MTPALSILVPSCDRYRDLWRPFMTLLRRHWPDCPYTVYFGSNHAECSLDGAVPLAIGDDISWSLGVRKMLERIDTPVVLVLLDDFFLRSRVDTARIGGLLNDFARLDAAYLRLDTRPPPDLRLARFPQVGEIALGAPYRASLQAALWRKEDFLAILRDEENPWQFEVLASRRADAFERGFYGVWENALDYFPGVVSGRWDPYGVAVLREQGVPIDHAARPSRDPRDVLAERARGVLLAPWYRMPWPARNAVIRWVRATGLRKPHPAGY